jgi:diguanylate cyclase (GGDEF)-like protein
LKDFANRDPLTGMLNRRFPFEYLYKEFARLKRIKGVLSIVIFDVDDFKYFNDKFGHDCGDEILISISKIILSNFRESDVCCRYGGDEFLIAMSGANRKEAKKRIEKLQRMIAEENYNSLCQEKINVTISVGIAAYPRNGESVDDVIKAADQALYLAKERGKNRIEFLD